MPRLFGQLFLGAGAMKAGTTWTYAALNRHPALHFTTEKELHYFHRRHAAGWRGRLGYLGHINWRILRPPPAGSPLPPVTFWRRASVNLGWLAAVLVPALGDGWYRRLFSFPRDEEWACDFSNLYALLPAEAWAEIAAKSDRLAVLYTLRDPVDRLWSQARFELAMQGRDVLATSWGPDEFAALIRRPGFWAHAEYGAAIRRMKAGLPEGGLKVVVYEDLHADPEAGLRGIEDFLGIGRHDYPRWLMRKRINEGPEAAMPDFFPGLVKGVVTRIVAEVEAEGVRVPESWRGGSADAPEPPGGPPLTGT